MNKTNKFSPEVRERAVRMCWRRCRFEPCAGFAVSRLERDEIQA